MRGSRRRRLAGLREELVSKTYRPDPVRRVPHLAMFLDGDVKALQAYHSGDRTGPIVMPYSSAWGWDIYCLLGSLNQELTTAFSVLRKRRRAMRKAMDAEQRERMLYLADLGTAVFSSALIVCVLRVVGDLM